MRLAYPPRGCTGFRQSTIAQSPTWFQKVGVARRSAAKNPKHTQRLEMERRVLSQQEVTAVVKVMLPPQLPTAHYMCELVGAAAATSASSNVTGSLPCDEMGHDKIQAGRTVRNSGGYAGRGGSGRSSDGGAHLWGRPAGGAWYGRHDWSAPSARLWHGVSCMALGGGGRSARRYRYVGLCVGTVRKVPRVRRVKINPKERKKKKRGSIALAHGIATYVLRTYICLARGSRFWRDFCDLVML